MSAPYYRVEVRVTEVYEDGTENDTFASWQNDTDLKTATADAVLDLTTYSYFIQEGS